MRWITRLIAIGLMSFPVITSAQSSDEIVVTASKRMADNGYEEPHIVMRRRPDNVILSVSVVCDTRDAVKRLRELEKTMVDVIEKSRAHPAIELGILIEREDDDGNEISFIRPYEHAKFGDYVSGGYRADTSAIELVLKTRVVDGYKTEEDAMTVLNKFIESVSTTGRTEVVSDDDPILSIISPKQYRYDIIRDIAADANKVSQSFGANYRVQVDGLEAPLVFYQTGELELTLYVPYGFDVVPPK